MKKTTSQVVIITGASSGFGAAMGEYLSFLGMNVALGARRVDRLKKLESSIQEKNSSKVFSHKLDVQSAESISNFVEAVMKHFGKIDHLINNAGFSHTLDPIEDSKEEDWQSIFDTNVLGVVRMSKAVIPHLKAGSRIINIGSTAGYESYEGGGSYCASKFALRAVTQTLRFELLERQIGVTTIDPGLAETEFSQVRFDGDIAKAKKVYQGLTPLNAQDIAEIAGFILTRPEHVNIDQILVFPTAQTSGRRILRRT